MQAPNRRVLHLHGRDGTRVHSDGTALKIEQQQQSPVWMPLDRIAVLVIQGPVDINSQTIATVLNAGATVRLLAADGAALGVLEPRAPGSADPNGDWRALYEQWLLKRNLLQAAVDLGAQLLNQELGRYLGPGAVLLKALAPGLRDTRTLRQNATRWVHRAIDLIEDAQGERQPGAASPAAATRAARSGEPTCRSAPDTGPATLAGTTGPRP